MSVLTVGVVLRFAGKPGQEFAMDQLRADLDEMVKQYNEHSDVSSVELIDVTDLTPHERITALQELLDDESVDYEIISFDELVSGYRQHDDEEYDADADADGAEEDENVVDLDSEVSEDEIFAAEEAAAANDNYDEDFGDHDGDQSVLCGVSRYVMWDCGAYTGGLISDAETNFGASARVGLPTLLDALAYLKDDTDSAGTSTDANTSTTDSE